MLPAREYLHDVPAIEDSVLLKDINQTLSGTRIAAFVRAKMCTVFAWPGTRLETEDMVM